MLQTKAPVVLISNISEVEMTYRTWGKASGRKWAGILKKEVAHLGHILVMSEKGVGTVRA